MLARASAERCSEMALAKPLLPLCLLAALLSGCGSSAPRPSYAAAGNAICSQGTARLHALGQPATAGAAMDYLPRVLAILHRETTALGALDTSGSQARLTAALTSTETLSRLLARVLSRLRGGMVEFGALASAQSQATALRAQADERFREAGLSACAA